MSLLMPLMITLHALSAVAWVGGMFFAYMALRPAAAKVLEPPERLTLWAHTFSRFFPWVWIAVVLLLLTGYGMLFLAFGGFAKAPGFIHIMQALGIVMVLIYLHLFFAPFKRLKNYVITQEWALAGAQLNQIRAMVGVNLIIGLVVVAVATGGRYL
jgi:uncharacterized membrane protein